MNDVLIVIPARYASTRFPGKPLARIGGVEMIVRVCRQAARTGFDVAVATDDHRIADVVGSAGFKAVMTSPDHRSGTDRVREAADRLATGAEVIVNIQGDEPFIRPSQIETLAACFADPSVQIATLARRFDKERGFDALFDPNLVKVTVTDNGNALCFSRSIIPYVRGTDWHHWLETAEYLTHVGVYAYRTETLRRLTELPQSSLEKAESLEQLRWLQNGYAVRVALTDVPTVGIDTPADLEEAEAWLRDHASDLV